MTIDETPVIFRKYKDGEVIALFPTDPGTNDPYTCSCYAHVGQHSSADPHGVISATRAARPKEYAALKSELETAPYSYRLRIYQRHRSNFLKLRRKAIAKTK